MNKLIIILITLFFTFNASAGSGDEAQCKINDINYGAAQVFVAELQEAIKSDNKNKVADLAIFPVKIRSQSKADILNITNKKMLINNYDRIFSKQVKRSLAKQNPKNIFCNWQGAMIAEGLIWFQSNEKEQGFFVINLP